VVGAEAGTQAVAHIIPGATNVREEAFVMIPAWTMISHGKKGVSSARTVDHVQVVAISHESCELARPQVVALSRESC